MGLNTWRYSEGLCLGFLMRVKNMAPLQSCTVLLLLAFSISRTFTHRIIGGQPVSPYSVKYQASLQYFNHRTMDWEHYCGGTLVHPQWVVSAAHCWRPKLWMLVVLSEHSLATVEGYEQIFDVEKIVVHPFYSYKIFNHDIMLIKLSRPALLNANVQPAVLPDSRFPLLPNTKCTVSGWGVTQIYSFYLSPELRSVDVKYMPLCSFYYYGMITPNMICAGSQFGGKDSCQGDSGGPLICNGKLEGIVSWGISCANPYFPGVYTRVRNYIYWINDEIRKAS